MNIPNTLSLFRLFLVPVYLVVFFSKLRHAHLIAAIIFVVAGITDIVDGYIARKYNQITKLGRILDPLADKFMVWSALISLSVVKIVPRIVTILYFIKEVLMGIGGLLVWRRTKDMPPSHPLGKASTLLFFISITVSILFDLPRTVVYLLFGTALLLMVVTVLFYIRRGVNILKETKSK
ncbi:MAG: CDP-alcohol phosphatidyltransferase family protein [Clostridia bacterium]|nr:CDP-alcohol phosphatidyltransferase family protein [Clostridia bacterium]